MRYSKVLLVTPSYPGRYFGGVRPPVGLGYIEEYLASRGVQSDAVDLNAGVGGPHVSAVEEQVLQQSPDLDFAVAGEGEVPMLELCLGTPLDGIHGLFYRANGEVRSGGPRRFHQDLDQLPFPRFRSYPLERYTNEIEIATSRGCPHQCIFCSVPNHMGRTIRYRNAKFVGDELECFCGLGVRSFQFGDDNFLADVDKSIELALRHPVMKVFFFNLVPFPGTQLYDWVKQRGTLLGPESAVFNRIDEWKLRARPFFETPEMPEHDRIVAHRRTAVVSRQIQVRTLERKLAHWGPFGKLAAQAGRFNALERLFVRNRGLRRFLDRVVFHPQPRRAGGTR